jgi:hypothetical protein
MSMHTLISCLDRVRRSLGSRRSPTSWKIHGSGPYLRLGKGFLVAPMPSKLLPRRLCGSGSVRFSLCLMFDGLWFIVISRTKRFLFQADCCGLARDMDDERCAFMTQTLFPRVSLDRVALT